MQYFLIAVALVASHTFAMWVGWKACAIATRIAIDEIERGYKGDDRFKKLFNLHTHQQIH